MEVNKESEDLIGRLPDDVLCSVLSFLTLKDAVRTSTLSSRWKHLWVARSSFNVNFDLPNLFGSEKEGREFEFADREPLAEGRQRFLGVVDHLMEFYKGRNMNSFRVSFYLDSEFASCIDQWVDSALASGVKDLTLLFCSNLYMWHYGYVPEEKLYSFPYWLLSQHSNSISKLCLEACIFRPPLNYTGFSNLSALKLSYVFVNGDFIEYLFSSCLSLVYVSLRHCCGIHHLNVVGASLRLEFLKVHECDDLVELKICAKNLTTFEFGGDPSTISSIHAPLLAKVCCFLSEGNGGIPLQFAHLPQLENLIVPLRFREVKSLHCIPSSFKNVKQLELYALRAAMFDLMWVCPVLKAFSVLQKLSIGISGQKFCEDEKEIQEVSGDSINELKEVHLAGFVGNWYELEFVKYVLKHASKLERLVIDPFKRMYGGYETRLTWDPDPSWYDRGQEVATKFLQEEVPDRVQLKVL